MKTIRRYGAWVTLVGVLALVAAGCGSSETPSETAASSDAETAAATSEATPAQGGTMTIAAAQGIAQLDPTKILYTWEMSLYPLLWSGLVRYTEAGGTEVEPDLAESWEVSDDLKTYTFKLRPDLTFSDGTPLDADAVVASVNYFLDPETAWVWGFVFPKVDKVEATDPTTVVITLATPSVSFPSSLSLIKIINVDNLADINTTPVVSGPYTVTEFVPDDRVALAPNPNYWGDAPPLDTLLLTKAQDSTSAVTGLQAGDINVLWNIPWSDVTQFEGNADFAIVEAANPAGSVGIEFDMTSPPFDNPDARKALAYAVDRQTILDAVYGGKGLLAATNQPVPSNSELFNSSLPEYTYDLAKAKELFAKAGINEGDTITYWTTPAFIEWQTVGEILQSNLKEIGINLEIQSNEINTWAEKFAPAGKTWPNMLVPNFWSGFPPPQSMGLWNPGICECNWDDETYAQLLQEADSTADPAARQDLYNQAQQTFAEAVPTIIIVETSFPIGQQSSVTGVWIDPGGNPRFENAAFTN